MPTVTRQIPKAKSGPGLRSGGSVLDRIAPIRSTSVGRLKVSLYGNPKTGKTRIACTFPKPLLIIGAEDGTASVAGLKNVDFVQLEQTDELTTLLEHKIRGGDYATVVLDTATKFRDMRTEEIFKVAGITPPEKKPFLYADAVWKSVWVQCAQDMKRFLHPLLDLPRTQEINIVIIAQEQNLYGEANNASEVIRPTISSALGKSVADWLNSECDYIGQTLIRAQTTERVQEVAGKELRTKVSTGKKEYCLRIGPHETYYTGFRQRIGAPELPEFVVNPTYEKIVKLIQG